MEASAEFNNRFTSSQQASGEIKYYLTNSGKVNTGVSSTSFYWSNDQNLDASDVLLGQQTFTDVTAETGQWEQFTFTKPTQQTGEYYIIYSLDAGNQVDEIFETIATKFQESNSGVDKSGKTILAPLLEDGEQSIKITSYLSSTGASNLRSLC